MFITYNRLNLFTKSIIIDPKSYGMHIAIQEFKIKPFAIMQLYFIEKVLKVGVSIFKFYVDEKNSS